MRLQSWKHREKNISFSLYLKCGAILLLFFLSVLIVACGGSGTNTTLGQPGVTVTINLGQDNGSPTPPLPAYTCSAWVTNTTPGINTTSAIGVYAKFVHNVNGNPEGVYPAQGTATALWPDGNVNVTANTTPDGLAIFSFSTANRKADLNKIILVTVAFQGPAGVPQCLVNVDRAAFFTLVVASPTANASRTPNPRKPCITPTGIGNNLQPNIPDKKTPTPCP